MKKSTIFAIIGTGVVASVVTVAYTVTKRKNKKKSDDALIQNFQSFLKDHLNDEGEAESVMETINRLKVENPDAFSQISDQMSSMMTGEWNLEQSRQFDKDNFKLLYASIDPDKLFVKNGFVILSIGPDHQEEMMNLVDALSTLKEENIDEYIEVIYTIYNIFEDLKLSEYTSDDSDDIYDKNFKTYVEKYVNNMNENPNENNNE